MAAAATGWVWQQRQGRCAEARKGFSRRPPIAGASGRDTFLCSAMYEGMPLGDKLIVLASFFAVLALFRSVAMDVHVHRIRSREPME